MKNQRFLASNRSGGNARAASGVPHRLASQREAFHQAFRRGLALALTVCAVLAANVTGAHDTNQLNRFSLNARIGFNITARFKDLGRLIAVPDTRRTPNGDRYNYDDGYVLRDVSDNFGGQTWYWGYERANQIAGDTVLMSRSRLVAGSASPFGVREDDPQLGAEFAYNRELGRGEKTRWGVEAAVNYLNVCFDDHRSFGAGTIRTTDAYPFTPGTTPPLPGYNGSFGGPGFVLGDTPVSSRTRFVANGATVAGRREFDADVWGFRLGPYVDFPLGTNWNFSLSAGVAVGLVDASAKWNERISLNGRLIATSRGQGDDLGVLWGGYVRGKFSYRLSDHWRLEGGAQFQALGKYEERIGGRKAELDLGQAIFVTAGLSYSF